MNKNFKGLWVPADIMKINDLSLTEKLFLSEIVNLDNSHGCFASNNYFSELFQLTPGRCSQIINSLKKKGYVSISLKKKGKLIEKRVLRILNRGIKNAKGGIKYSKGGIKNTKGGYLENAKDNININTLNNDIEYINHCDSKESPPDDAPLELFSENKIKVKPVLGDENWKYIESLFREKKEYDNWGKQRRHVKDLDKRIQKIYKNKAPPISLKEFTKKCVDFFWFLKQHGKQIWKDQAFFPSTLNSERIWTMYLEEIEQRRQPSEKELMKGLEDL